MQPQGEPGTPAWRLTFRYEGDSIQLVAKQQVEMILPPSDPVQPPQGQSGFWYTVLDADGRPLYRRVLHPPIRVDAEVFAPEPGDNIRRVPISRPQGTFVLLVPDLEAGRTLVLHMHPLEPGAQAQPAREIARLDLRAGGEQSG